MKMREAGTGLGWRCKYVTWICGEEEEDEDKKWKL
jgi:hypothetical protein